MVAAESWATTQRDFFDNHPDGLAKTDRFVIYVQRAPHLLSAEIISKGEWEPATSALFEKLVTDGCVVVDVGANIGWYTLLAARRAGKVYAYEPEPTNLELLRKSVAANGYDNVVASPLAISSSDGRASLHLSEVSAGWHSIARNVGVQTLEVPCRTLDTLFPKSGIDLLKIDVEGYEPEVIAGAKELIAQHRLGHVVLEWNPEAWRGRVELLAPFDAYAMDGTRFDLGLSSPTEENIVLHPRDGSSVKDERPDRR